MMFFSLDPFSPFHLKPQNFGTCANEQKQEFINLASSQEELNFIQFNKLSRQYEN